MCPFQRGTHLTKPSGDQLENSPVVGPGQRSALVGRPWLTEAFPRSWDYAGVWDSLGLVPV